MEIDCRFEHKVIHNNLGIDDDLHTARTVGDTTSSKRPRFPFKQSCFAGDSEEIPANENHGRLLPTGTAGPLLDATT